MGARDVAGVAGMILRDIPDDFEENVAAKSVRAYRNRQKLATEPAVNPQAQAPDY